MLLSPSLCIGNLFFNLQLSSLRQYYHHAAAAADVMIRDDICLAHIFVTSITSSAWVQLLPLIFVDAFLEQVNHRDSVYGN